MKKQIVAFLNKLSNVYPNLFQNYTDLDKSFPYNCCENAILLKQPNSKKNICFTIYSFTDKIYVYGTLPLINKNGKIYMTSDQHIKLNPNTKQLWKTKRQIERFLSWYENFYESEEKRINSLLTET